MPFAVRQPNGTTAHVIEFDAGNAARFLLDAGEAYDLGFFKAIKKFIQNNKNTIGTVASIAGPVLAPVTGGASLLVAGAATAATGYVASEQQKQLVKEAEEAWRAQNVTGAIGAVQKMFNPAAAAPASAAPSAFDLLPVKERTWLNQAQRIEAMGESQREALLRTYTPAARKELNRAANQHAAVMGTSFPQVRATIARLGNAPAVIKVGAKGAAGSGAMGVAALVVIGGALLLAAGRRR